MTTRRRFLQSVLGLAVAQAFLPPVRSVRLLEFSPAGYGLTYCGTETGRLSSNSPCYSNIPKRMDVDRALFETDYSVAELRVLSWGYYTGDYRHE